MKFFFKNMICFEIFRTIDKFILKNGFILLTNLNTSLMSKLYLIFLVIPYAILGQEIGDDFSTYYYYERTNETRDEIRVYDVEDPGEINPVFYNYLLPSQTSFTSHIFVDHLENATEVIQISSFNHPDTDFEMPTKLVFTSTVGTAYDAFDNVIASVPILEETSPLTTTQIHEDYIEWLKLPEVAPYIVTNDMKDEFLANGYSFSTDNDLQIFSKEYFVIIYSEVDHFIKNITYDSLQNITVETTDFYYQAVSGAYRPVSSISKTRGVDPDGLSYYDISVSRYSDLFIYRSSQLIEDRNEEGDITVSPNPTNTTFSVGHTKIINFTFNDVLLMNINTGQIVLSWSGDFDGASLFDVSVCTSGFYAVSVDGIYQAMISIN